MAKCKYCGERADFREPFETAEQPQFVMGQAGTLIANPNCPMVDMCSASACAEAHWEALRADPHNGKSVAAVERAFEQDRLRCLAGQYDPDAKARAEKDCKQ